MTPTTFLSIARAVGDPTRLRLLVALDNRSLTVGELAAAVGISSAAVSYHLRLMRGACLVALRREGRCTIVRRDEGHWACVERMLGTPTWERW
jgi:DNA-binding transcriptional ArsR family regulator